MSAHLSTSQHLELTKLTQRNGVDHQDTLIEWHKLEVCHLNQWPYHPVLTKSSPVGRLELFRWARALHHGHRGQEEGQVATSKHSLIQSNASQDLKVGSAWKYDFALKEAEPSCSSRTKDSCESCQRPLFTDSCLRMYIPPPYKAILPVRPSSCLSNPFFSTNC